MGTSINRGPTLGIPTIATNLLLLLTFLVKVVIGDEVDIDFRDPDDVATHGGIDVKERSGVLWRKVGKFTVGEIIFMVLGVLALLCFVVSTVLSLLYSDLILSGPSKPEVGTSVSFFAILGCILLVAFSVCGCYLSESKGCLTQCKKICLWVAILLFCAFLSLIIIEIYVHVGQLQSTKNTPYFHLLKFLTFFCLFLHILLMIGILRQCIIKGTFTTSKLLFVEFSALPLLCIIAMVVIEVTSLIHKTENSSLPIVQYAFPAIITIGFLLVIAQLSMAFYIGFFGKTFTVLEIVFGTLGTLIILCFVILVIFKVNYPLRTNLGYAPWGIHILQFLLLVPFLYCAYRLHLLDSLIALFKGEKAEVKSNNLKVAS